jgi:ATP-binding cassette subfamily B multidrug efflux pump
MQDFLKTVHAQMRLVSGFEIVNQVLSVPLIVEHRRRWRCGSGPAAKSGVGAVAASIAMALRLQRHLPLGHVEMASLFEHVGHGAGRHGTALPAQLPSPTSPMRANLAVTRGEVRFERVDFAYPNGRRVIEDLNS